MPRVSLRDARIRTKLAAVLLIPVISTLGLAAAVLTSSGSNASEARQAARLAEVSQSVTKLSDALHHERMTAAAYLNKTIANTSVLKSFFAETDARIAELAAARDRLGKAPGDLEELYARIRSDMDGLPSIRLAATTPDTSIAALLNRYTQVVGHLDAYVIAASSWFPAAGDVAVEGHGLAVYSAARSAAAEAQATAYAVLTTPGGVTREMHEAYVGAYTAQQVSMKFFTQLATGTQDQITKDMITREVTAKADAAAAAVSRSAGSDLQITPDQANHDIGALVDVMRQAQERLEGDFSTLVDNELSTAQNLFNIEAAVVAVLLLAEILMGFFVSRLMIRSLERLRSGALAVAHRSLRLTVDKLSDARGLDERTADVLVREMGEDIGVTGDDEIGEVAQAFHVVHREAVRIAADQAVLRATVSAMFLSLARRSQTLVDRMIAELDAIERHEQDPKRLAEMFRLDHLATRMRRNDENLLVLAGADASPARGADAGLEDVLRAAQSEVELYDRIEFSAVDHDTLIAAHAVNDVVRMTAELMDNATRFSPPGTLVLADARRINDFVLIQVEDRGLGMSDEQLMSVNDRLATPGAVDVSAFRMMGLGVVSRLASRYGIKAELRRNADSGITASLTLPRGILVLPRVDSQSRGRHLAISEGGRHALPAGPSSPSLSGLSRSGLPSRVPGQQMSGEPMSAPPMPVSAAPVSSMPTYAPVTPPSTPLAPGSPLAPPSSSPLAPPSSPLAPPSSSPLAPPSSPLAPPSSSPLAPPSSPLAPAPLPQPPLAAPAPPAPAPTPAPPPPAADDTREMPIFREISASWFGNVPGEASGAPPAPKVTGRASVTQDTVRSDWPSAGAPPPAPVSAAPTSSVPTSSVPTSAAPAPAASAPASPVPAAVSLPRIPGTPDSPPVPRQRVSAVDVVAGSVGSGVPAEDTWHSTADNGWRAAAAAAKPVVSETTRSGLPIRTPQANLVPGSVSEPAPARVRRTPEQVQGLLSAYTRGVQRGRDDLQTTAQSEESQ